MFNVLLQVLDDGRLTDGQGRTVDFRNTVIIMTSTSAPDHPADLAARGQARRGRCATRSWTTLRQHFRPEFLNRIDEIVIFHPLDADEIRQIVDIQLARLREASGRRGPHAGDHRRGRDLLAREGYDPVYGARPLKRALQRLVMDPLALKLLRGEFKPGEVIVGDAQGDVLEFRSHGEPAPTQPRAHA